MTAWHVAPDLATLIDQVKTKHPGMTVYTIGDAAHQAEPSDHNPDADGSVNAADFMIGPHFTAADASDLASRLQEALDPRMAYFIYNRLIVSTTISPGVRRSYPGPNPHTDHVHVSVTHTASAERNTTPWQIEPKEDDMPSPDDIANAVLKLDGVIDNAPTAGDFKTNPELSLATAVHRIYDIVQRLSDTVNTLSAKVDKLAPKA